MGKLKDSIIGVISETNEPKKPAKKLVEGYNQPEYQGLLDDNGYYTWQGDGYNLIDFRDVGYDYHSGMSSPLYSFSSTDATIHGRDHAHGLVRELETAVQVAADHENKKDADPGYDHEPFREGESDYFTLEAFLDFAKKVAAVYDQKEMQQGAPQQPGQGDAMTKESIQFKKGSTYYYKGNAVIAESATPKNGMLPVRAGKAGVIAVSVANLSTKKPALNESVFIAPISFAGAAAPKAFDLSVKDFGFDEIVAVREDEDGYDGEKKDTHYNHSHGMPDPSDTVATAYDEKSGPKMQIDPLTTEPGAQEGGHIAIDMQKLPADAPVIPDAQADDSGNSRPVQMSSDMDAGNGGDGETSDDKFTNSDGPQKSGGEEPKKPEAKAEPAASEPAKEEPKKEKTDESAKPGRHRFREALVARCAARGRALNEDGENGTITLTMEAAMVVLGSIAEQAPSIDMVAKIVEALDSCSTGQPLGVQDLQQVQAAVKDDGAAAPADGPEAPVGGADDGMGGAPVPATDGEPAEPTDGGEHVGKDRLMAGGMGESRRPYFGIDDIEAQINESMRTDEEDLIRLRRITGQKDWWKKK